MGLTDKMSDASRKRLAGIMRAKLRRVCANADLCESISDDELIRQAEQEHERQLAKFRAKVMSLDFAAANLSKKRTR